MAARSSNWLTGSPLPTWNRTRDSPSGTGAPEISAALSGPAIDQLISATTYGLPLDLFFTQFDSLGNATHPIAKGPGPVVVTGTPGHVLVTARLSFGSFAHD